MCTVSFIATKTGVIITSNRDEHILRVALPPQKYLYNQKSIIYPKDVTAGGTWYATDGISKVIVLLNGAAEKHTHNPPYRRSRGLIVLDLISTQNPISEWKIIDLMVQSKISWIWMHPKITFGLRRLCMMQQLEHKEPNGLHYF
jgi:uncharacterized protein with NRDE domain